jgi:Cdc6-like AAA superfamily ATPase
LHADIQNVFTPALAIDDAARFAGRQEQLNAVSMALQSQGTQIVIYGNRGVGKSSLGRQLEGLARGDMNVIDRLTNPPHSVPDFLVISFECDDSLADIRALILRLLTEDAALAPWIPFRVEKTTVAGEMGGGLNVKVISVSGKGSTTSTLSRDEYEIDLYAAFGNAVGHIIESGVARDGVLFIVDEIDRIKNRDDLASFIRSRGADPRVKFALVGVETTPQELILNHESIARQISDGCIEMPPMSSDELREIFAKAHQVLKADGIQFSESAQNWIIQIARGHPYYVHLLGKHALIKAVEAKEKIVSEEMARKALAEIAVKGTARIQETTYQKAIGHSYTRELIVKTFAAEEDEEIHTTSVYPKIASARSIDISSISVYVGQLASEKYGAILEKTRERYYRFKDSLFKAYAAARPYNFQPDQVEADES